MTTELSKKLLMQIGAVYDIMTTTKIKSQEYTIMRTKLDSIGLHMLKYLQRRKTDKKYLSSKQQRQPPESNSEEEPTTASTGISEDTAITTTSDKEAQTTSTSGKDEDTTITNNNSDSNEEAVSRQNKQLSIATLHRMLQTATDNNNDMKLKRYTLWIDMLTNHSHVTPSKQIAKEMRQYRRKERRKERRHIITDKSLDVQ